MKKKDKCNCQDNCECGCKDKKECTCENCECNEDSNCKDNCDCENCNCENCNCDDKKEKKSKKDNKLVDLEEKNKVLNDRVLRLSAEIQNLGKRHTEEMLNMFKYEGIELIKSILPIVDNFERAIEMDKSVNEKYLEGYKMIYSNLLEILKNYGVKEIECQDKEFDPNTMEAIMTEHVDGVEPNYVLVVLQKGYIYKDKVIRHAFVKVSE